MLKSQLLKVENTAFCIERGERFHTYGAGVIFVNNVGRATVTAGAKAYILYYRHKTDRHGGRPYLASTFKLMQSI
jgi:hypothetical protein